MPMVAFVDAWPLCIGNGNAATEQKTPGAFGAFLLLGSAVAVFGMAKGYGTKKKPGESGAFCVFCSRWARARFCFAPRPRRCFCTVFGPFLAVRRGCVLYIPIGKLLFSFCFTGKLPFLYTFIGKPSNYCLDISMGKRRLCG